MAAKNDITGDSIQTRQITDSYRDNFDKIFRKKKDEPTITTDNSIRDIQPAGSNDNQNELHNGVGEKVHKTD